MQKYEESFTVHVEGERTGEMFHGEFTVKTLLSHRDYARQDKLRRELLGEGDAMLRTVSSAEILSQLAVRVVKAPSWWSETGGGLDMLDDAPIAEVYTKTMAAEKAVLDARTKKADDAKKALAEPIQPQAE